jgi:hypothetical protein
MPTPCLILLNKTFSFKAGKSKVKCSTINRSWLQPIREVVN